MIPFFVFVLGLIFGSFLNAIIYRLHIGQSFIKGRSRCPDCQHQLATKDLIPIASWLSLGGRCRYCKKPISWQYPLVELVTGLAFVTAFLVADLGSLQGILFDLQLSAWLIYSLFLIVIFVYDYKHYIILDQVVLPAVIIAFIFNLFLGFVWWQMLLAAIVASGFFWLQYIVSKGRWIGGGDIKLGLLMGMILSWPYVLVALFLAYVSGSLAGIGLIMAGKKKLGSRLPFGTFLTLATFITMLYGQQLLDWYLGFVYG